jgi:acetolactate synthase-1/2/3 large subunit
MNNKFLGSEVLIQSLLEEKVEYIFGYPGGAIMPIYDAIYKYRNQIKHILVRHEQGAIHAAQGYARSSGKIGVCFTTSGPGATNIITGLVDALIDSTPLLCITGQVDSKLLGTDAFQETSIIDLSIAATKWNVQINNVKDICKIISEAFYIAKQGRPGPVLVDITKNAQLETTEFNYNFYSDIEHIDNISNHIIDQDNVRKAAKLINNAKKPFILIGQGVIISDAEKEVKLLVEKGNIPFASTLLGLGVIEKNHRLNFGMLGMHGNYAPNMLTNQSDVIIAIGMRFDDRVTGSLNEYARQAKIIHIDIDDAEINKNVTSYIPIIGDCKKVLNLLINMIYINDHREWVILFDRYRKKEDEVVVSKDLYTDSPSITMGEVISCINNYKSDNSVLVTDVGQHQMISARYFNFTNIKTHITSGGLGTMGFALPAAIGVQFSNIDREVICVVGDGGFQMTIQELGTIMQYKLPIKIIIMNNQFLGMVRQWQEFFFNSRYSCTNLINPSFIKIADAYNIPSNKVINKSSLSDAIEKMFSYSRNPYLLEVMVNRTANVFPMIISGSAVDKMRLK